jgi:tetratricopeptide (TPR) repeat protein
MKPSIASAGLALFLAASAFAQTTEGDQHWAARAEGHQGGHATATHANAAIAAYQRAISQSPNDLEPRWKLLRAFRFKGQYVATSKDEKKAIYSDAKRAGDEAMAVLDRQLQGRGLKSVVKASEKQVAESARAVPGAGELFLWDAINWGEWALVYGKLAAVKEGAADRIRRESTIAMLIDPRMEGGSPARVLGRLHDQTPHVPFLTGWASSREAVRLLNESLKIDPPNKITRVFLAEAMVNDNSDTKPQAIQMLKDTIAAPNPPDFDVEQSAATEDARALLRKWGG